MTTTTAARHHGGEPGAGEQGGGGRLKSGDKPVPSARDGFYESWVVSIIAYRHANFGNGCIEGVVEIDERILRPHPISQLVSRH